MAESQEYMSREIIQTHLNAFLEAISDVQKKVLMPAIKEAHENTVAQEDAITKLKEENAS